MSVSAFCLTAERQLLADESQPTARARPDFPPADVEFFEKEVRPLLAARCYQCHSADAKRLEGGLRLDSRVLALKGGDSGAAFQPGSPAESLLVDAINYGDVYQMPPKSKLSAKEIDILTRWVKLGGPWGPEDIGGGESAKEFDIDQRRASHWAWSPLQSPKLPEVNRADWPTTPADYFILKQIEDRGLIPAAKASKRTLIRRVYFDLIGLPPTPDEVDQFLADESPEAFEKVVDHLLDSPHFGERWGRHWLDLVRYAESRGHEFDHNAPNVWRYRDYVIRGLNADVPYDQWLKEHVAGDLLPHPRRSPTEGFNESILGTGFWFLGEWVHSPVSIRKDETDRYDNMIDTMSKTFLGLTVACARCHDHKFDAISQADYYALAGYLQSSSYRQARFETLDDNLEIAGKLDALRAEYAPKVAGEVVQRWRPALDKVADYLLAEREIRKEGSELAEAAGKHGLNASLLDRWVKAVDRARDDRNHPLHLWAQGGEAEGAAGALEKQLAPLRQQWSGESQAIEQSLADVEVVIDYANCNPADWMPDGAAFGVGPTRAGTLVLGADPANPLSSVATRAAAVRDRAFDGLALSGGTERDPGRFGKVNRAGLSLRTPTFTITTGQLYYLARGTADIYVVVDSHRLNEGPLHSSLIGRWGDEGKPTARWIGQNVSKYIGHRAHVEFTAPETGDCEIQMVVQAKRSPGAVEGANPLLVDLGSGPQSASLAALASGYQSLLQTVASQLSAAQLTQNGKPGAARLADWLVRNEALFVEQSDSAAGEKAREFTQRLAELAGKIRKASATAPAMLDGSREDEFLLIRGGYNTPGDIVPHRFLTALGGDPAETPGHGSGRLQLAEQMLAEQNPLAARVQVNRVWHHLFGVGIVPSVDNFGVLGQAPSHPALLDHLASEYRRDGWSTKRLIRRLALSSTYQMSSQASDEAIAADPTNVFLSHARIRRLEGEAIRDSLLAISGRLDRKMYGPSTPVFLTPFMQGRGRPGGGPLDGAGRRSIYISVRRNFLSPMMLAFDTPIPFNTVGRRNVSNVPAQALILMNDPFVVEQARLWAARLLGDKSIESRQRVRRMYEEAFAREPADEEIEQALAFLTEQTKQYGLPPEQAATNLDVWRDLCHVMINVKEFIFIN
jgi:hypothetical protein